MLHVHNSHVFFAWLPSLAGALARGGASGEAASPARPENRPDAASFGGL